MKHQSATKMVYLGVKSDLTPREGAILEELIRHGGAEARGIDRYMDHQEIGRLFWSRENWPKNLVNSVNQVMYGVRKKAPAGMIENKRAVGWRIVPGWVSWVSAYNPRTLAFRAPKWGAS